uniref:Uncharacterized protein n=1 Tax=Arundo donax TaxID=35708 RepID=A0A0A9A8C7_ARUDO
MPSANQRSSRSEENRTEDLSQKYLVPQGSKHPSRPNF